MKRLLALAVVFVAGGCLPAYVAPAANAPLLSKAYELHLAGALGTNGIDLQVAGAPMEGWGVLGSGSFGHGGYQSHKYVEVASGYFHPSKTSIRIEGFVGAGRGSYGASEFGNGDHNAISTGSYSRLFAQIDMGDEYRNAEIGGCVRLAAVRLQGRETSGHTGRPPGIGEYAGIWRLFVEPVAFVRAGLPWGKAELQVGLPMPATLAPPWVFPLHLSLGWHLEFDDLIDEAAAAAR